MSEASAQYPTTDWLDAIAAGVKRAEALGMAKPFDVALCIDVALSDAGYRVVRKPRLKNGG